LELFAELYGSAAGEWVEQLRATQTLLGSISDCSVTSRLVEDMGAGGGMVAALKNWQKRKTREFRQASEEGLGSADAAKLWVHALCHPPRKPILPLRRYRGHRRILLAKGKGSKPTNPRSRCSSTGRRHQVA